MAPDLTEIGLVVLKSTVEVKLVDKDGNVLWAHTDSNADTIWAKVHTPVSGTLKLDLVADTPIQDRLGGELDKVQKTCWNRAKNLRSELIDVSFTHDSGNKRYEAGFNWTNTGAESRQIYGLVAYVDDNVYATFVFDPPVQVDPSIVFIGRYIIEYTQVTPNLNFGSNLSIDLIENVNRMIGVFPVIDRGFRLYKLTRGVAKSSEYWGVDTGDTTFSSVVLYTYSNSDPHGYTYTKYRFSGELRWQILVSGEPNGATAVRKFVTKSVLDSGEQFWSGGGDGNFTTGDVPALHTRDIFIDPSEIWRKVVDLGVMSTSAQKFTSENEYERYVYEVIGWKLLRGGEVKPFLFRFPNDTSDVGSLVAERWEAATYVGFFPWLKVFGGDAGYFIAYLYWNDSPTFTVRFIHGDDSDDKPTEVYLYLNGTKFTGTISYPSSRETEVTFDLSSVTAGDGVVVLKVLPQANVAKPDLTATAWRVGDWSFAIKSDMWGYVVPYAGAFKNGTAIAGNWINSAYFNLNGTDVALDEIGTLTDSDIANLAPVQSTSISVLDEKKWPFWVWVRAGDLNTTVGVLDDSKPLYVYKLGSGFTYEDYDWRHRIFCKFPIYSSDAKAFAFGTVLFEYNRDNGRGYAWIYDPAKISWLFVDQFFENDYVKKDWANRELAIKKQAALGFHQYETTFWVIRRQGDISYDYLIPSDLSDYSIGESTKTYGGVVYEFETTLTQNEQFDATTFTFDSGSVFTNGEFFTVPVADDQIMIPIDALEKWNYAKVDFPLKGSLEWIPATLTVGSDDCTGDFSEGTTPPGASFFVASHVDSVEDTLLASDITVGDATHRAVFEVINKDPFVLYIPKVFEDGGITYVTDVRSIYITDGIRVFGYRIDPNYAGFSKHHLPTISKYWPVIVHDVGDKVCSTSNISFIVYAYFKAIPVTELFPERIRVYNLGDAIGDGHVVRISLPFAIPKEIDVRIDGNSVEFCLLNDLGVVDDYGNNLYVKLPALGKCVYSSAKTFNIVAGSRLFPTNCLLSADYPVSYHSKCVGYNYIRYGTFEYDKSLLNPSDDLFGSYFVGKPFFNEWTDVPYKSSFVDVEIIQNSTYAGQQPSDFFAIYISHADTGSPVFYENATSDNLIVDGFTIVFNCDAGGSVEWQVTDSYNIVECLLTDKANIWFWAANNEGDYSSPLSDTNLEFDTNGLRRYCLTRYDLGVTGWLCSSPDNSLYGKIDKLGVDYNYSNIYAVNVVEFVYIIGYLGSQYLYHKYSSVPVFESLNSVYDSPLISDFYFPIGSIEPVSPNKRLMITDFAFADRRVAAYKIPVKELPTTSPVIRTVASGELEWAFPVFEDEKGVVSPLSDPNTDYFFVVPQCGMDFILPTVYVGYVTDDAYIKNKIDGGCVPIDCLYGYTTPQFSVYIPGTVDPGFTFGSGDFVYLSDCMPLRPHVGTLSVLEVVEAYDGVVVGRGNWQDVPFLKHAFYSFSLKSPVANYVGWWANIINGGNVAFAKVIHNTLLSENHLNGSYTKVTDVIKIGAPSRFFNYGFLSRSFYGNELSDFGNFSVWSFAMPESIFKFYPIVKVYDTNADTFSIYGLSKDGNVIEISAWLTEVSYNNAKRVITSLNDVSSFAPFSSLLVSYGTADYQFSFGVLVVYSDIDFDFQPNNLCAYTNLVEPFGGYTDPFVIGGDTCGGTASSPPALLNGRCAFCSYTYYAGNYVKAKAPFIRGVFSSNVVTNTYRRQCPTFSNYVVGKMLPNEVITRSTDPPYIFASPWIGHVLTKYTGLIGITGFSLQLNVSDPVQYCYYNQKLNLYANDISSLSSDTSSNIVRVYNPNDDGSLTHVIKLDVSDYDLSGYSSLVCRIDGNLKPTAYEAADGTLTTSFSEFGGKYIYVRTTLAPNSVVDIELVDQLNTYAISDVFDFYDDFNTFDSAKWTSLQYDPSSGLTIEGSDYDGGTVAESQRVSFVSVPKLVSIIPDGLQMLPDGLGDSGIAGVVSNATFSKDLIFEIDCYGASDRLQVVIGSCDKKQTRVPFSKYYKETEYGLLLKANFSPDPSKKYKLRVYNVDAAVTNYFRDLDCLADISVTKRIGAFYFNYIESYQVYHASKKSVTKKVHGFVSRGSGSQLVRASISDSFRNNVLYTSSWYYVYYNSDYMTSYDKWWYADATICIVGDSGGYVTHVASFDDMYYGMIYGSSIYSFMADVVDATVSSTRITASGTIDGYSYTSYDEIEVTFNESAAGVVFTGLDFSEFEFQRFIVANGQTIFSNINDYLTGVRFGQSAECTYISSDEVEQKWVSWLEPIPVTFGAKVIGTRDPEIFVSRLDGYLRAADGADFDFTKVSETGFLPASMDIMKGNRFSRDYDTADGNISREWALPHVMHPRSGDYFICGDVSVVYGVDDGADLQVETRKTVAAGKVVTFGPFQMSVAVLSNNDIKFAIETEDGEPLKKAYLEMNTNAIPDSYKIALINIIPDTSELMPVTIRKIIARPAVPKEPIQLKLEDVYIVFECKNSNWYLFDFTTTGMPNKDVIETAIAAAKAKWPHSPHYRPVIDFPDISKIKDSKTVVRFGMPAGL